MLRNLIPRPAERVMMALVLLAGWARAAPTSPVLVCGFDDAAALYAWRTDPGVSALPANQHVTQGTGSVQVTFPATGGGLSLEFHDPVDWSGHAALELDLCNPELQDITFALRLTDAAGRTFQRTRLLAAQADARLTVRLAEADGLLDRARIARLWVGLMPDTGPATLFADALQLTPERVVATVAAAGETIIQAEDYSRGNFTINPTGWGEGPSPIIQDPLPPAEGPGFAEYDLMFVAPGRYRLQSLHASAEPRMAAILMDGALIDGAALTGTTGSFTGASAKWFPVAVIPVSAGRHTLRLQHSGSSLPHVDALSLTPTTDPVMIPALSARAETIQRLLDRTLGMLRNLPPGPLAADIARARQEWDAIWTQGTDVAVIQRGMSEFEQRRSGLFGQAMVACTAHGYGARHERLTYAVGVESPVRKVFWPALDFSGQVGAPVRISLARGEYEGAQVVVLAGERPLRGVRVSVSELVGPGGRRLGQDCLTVHPVGYVDVSGHPKKGEQEGEWFPDPLVVNAPFGVAPHHAQPVWITVHAPPNTEPGEYRGEVTIAPRAAERVRVPLTVRVWNFTLPAESHLKTTFVMWWSRAAISRPEFEQWVQFALNYRMGIMDIGWGWGYPDPPYPVRRTDQGYDFSRLDEDLQWCFDRHMSCTSMADFAGGPYSEDYVRELRRFLTAYAAHLRERGWFDRAYLKLQDEPQPEHYEAVRIQADLVKSIDPAIRRLCTVRIIPELIGAVDIWCPITTQCDLGAAAAARARGEEVWVYTCGGPAPPAPNIAYIHQEALGSRLLGWHCWRLGASGYLYWGIRHWPAANTTRQDHNLSAWIWAQGSRTRFVPREEAGSGWPALPWIAAETGLVPGDGYVAYPGPHGEPLPSIRLEAFRDGVEDVEYLSLLARRVEAAERAGKRRAAQQARDLLARAENLITPHGDHDRNPARLLKLREDMGQELSHG